MFCSDRSAAYWFEQQKQFESAEAASLIVQGSPCPSDGAVTLFRPKYQGGLEAARPPQGWSNIYLPGNLSYVKLYNEVFKLALFFRQRSAYLRLR